MRPQALATGFGQPLDAWEPFKVAFGEHFGS
nr:hypothetical protein I308_06498 [Cryptococcus tetragattii IND107]